ncbi:MULTISPECIES: hypothetical protein [unclassified Streptomyces]|uniref:hypothetical protein n=1 Tax=unclassified Streptomyces TaxID=2593676 RepID=UPI0036552ADC
MRYEHRPGKRSGSGDKDKGSGKGDKAFGCLVLLSTLALFAFLVVSDMFWGDDTWKWSADRWPGGAYGFAMFLGALVPCVATLFVLTASRTDWKSWKSHKVRSFGFTLLAVVCGAAMLQLVSLIYNAQNTGKWGRGPDSSPSWVFSNYPWLWAVGLVSTVAMATLLIAVAVARDKRTSPATDAGAPAPN